MARPCRCHLFGRLGCDIFCLFLLAVFLRGATPAEQQQSLPATAPAESSSCSLGEDQAGTRYSTQQQVGYQGSADFTPAAAAAAASKHLQDQVLMQQQMINVLSSITDGTFTAGAATSLLQDAAALHESLLHGAAARRWAKLKARSAKGRTRSYQQPNMQQEARPSQGILIVAGGQHQFLNAYILLQLLRHPTINCSLPAELVYYGPHEFAPATAKLMKAHAAKTSTHLQLIDGSEAAAVELQPHAPVHVRGFRTKVHALAFVTLFDQVLLLDSDNTPLADPTYLFASAAFAASGNLQWLDFWTNQWMQPALYSLLGLDVPWEVNPKFRASEAGQLLLDRVRHYDVLEWLWLLNRHSSSGVPGVREAGVVGKCFWGDKDTYLIAFQLAGKGLDVANVPHYPLQALSRPAAGSMFVHAGMLQRGVHGELLFLHRTAAGKLWPHCARQNRQGCRVWGATTPVNQKQLVSSVRDVTAMQFEAEKIDLLWQDKHCGREFDAAAGQAAVGVGDGAIGDISKRPHWNATMLACELNRSAGLLPIPVIALQHLPEQVQHMLNLTYTTFLETLPQPAAAMGRMAADLQNYEEDSDPYY